MMKIAIPVFRSRISPVFDVAPLLLLVEIEKGRDVRRQQAILAGKFPRERVEALVKDGVDVLICGGITGPTRSRAESAGIRVYSGVAGDVEQILAAFRKGSLDRACFRMPGCGRRRRRHGRYGGPRV